MTSWIRPFAPITAGLTILLSSTTGPSTRQVTPTAPTTKIVDLAICLDTSGSMRGLLDSARQGIWAIVNDLALATPTPKMRVSLLTFGNDGHNMENGWVEVATDLTEDLDRISEKLFALTTNGGTELVGRVVHTAVERLSWSDDPGALKLMIVAGNESADQDRDVPFAEACKTAVTCGIQINSIYCGDPDDDIAPGWREVARLADGQFHAINHNQQQVAIATPFDAQLQALNVTLNDTYLPFGTDGLRGCSNQTAQDFNAANCNSEVIAQRVLAKSTSNYSNRSWDLVDAVREETFQLDEVKDEDLPEVMRGQTLEQKQVYLEQMRSRRTQIQQDVQALAKQRQAAVLVEMNKRSQDPSTAFDYAVRKAVRTQAAARGIHVQDLADVPATPTSKPEAIEAPAKPVSSPTNSLVPTPTMQPATRPAALPTSRPTSVPTLDKC